VAQGIGPEFKPQYHKKKKKEEEEEELLLPEVLFVVLFSFNSIILSACSLVFSYNS
jgi:hypothetical protein